MLSRTLLALLLLALPISAGAAPGDAVCTPIPDAAGNLVCALMGGVFAPAPPAGSSCTPLDLKGLGKKLKETNAISFFGKLALASEIEELLTEGRTIRDAGLAFDRTSAFRTKYVSLHERVVKKLANDPLAAELSCNRDMLWNALLKN